MDAALSFILIVFGLACVLVVLTRNPMPRTKNASSGELLITGAGEAVIDEPIEHSRELLRRPRRYVTVEFDPCELPPPCSGGGPPDALVWELIIVRCDDRGCDEMRLKISWNVATSRRILWSVRQPERI